MSAWMPSTYFPDLTELLDDTVTFSAGNGPRFFSVSLPRADWERMGRPGRVTFEPYPVIPTVLSDAASSRQPIRSTSTGSET